LELLDYGVDITDNARESRIHLGGRMKERTILASFIIPATGLFLLFGTTFAEMPEAGPKALWTYITKTSPYRKWGHWPDHQGMQPGRAPHGPLHKVYVNDRGLASSNPPVQYGSIQVKESYSKTRELKTITVMYKSHKYNPYSGDWFWAEYSPTGRPRISGTPAGCVGCHATRARNDFIIVHEFR